MHCFLLLLNLIAGLSPSPIVFALKLLLTGVPMSPTRFLLALITGVSLSPFAFAANEPTLEQRLEKLTQSLEAARVDAHVPGMSIAIVKDDQLVYARGFGHADVEGQKPADEETIYAIGSSTKAFTATLIGMLVDDGKLNWDDPVTNYLPYFDLAVRSEDEDATCTLRDLLSHRHGFSRMGILWFGGKVPSEVILRTAAGAEPLDDFRKGFHYCNVTYLAAGEASAVAADSTWTELIRSRIFEPLHMNSSTLSIGQAKRDARFARGYRWDDTDGQHVLERLIPLENIAPAGSINSNVLDMAQWIRFQLGRGEIDGKRLISAERIHDTWTSQIAINDEISYGMGWMLREHDGRKVIDHGGNIDGFSAQVSLMPEEGLGYVLLINQSASPMREPSLPIVFDALLDEWPDETEAPDAVASATSHEDYVGTYVANFASFRNEEFKVLNKGDRLAIDIPSQQVLDLKAPDAEGKWYAVLTDQIAASFQRNDKHEVVSMSIHQSGFNFVLPRKGYEPAPEVPAQELEKFVGIFVRAKGSKRVKLFIQGGRLTMEDKGNHMAFKAPDDEGYAPFESNPNYSAAFAIDANGDVDSFVFHGDSGDQLFTRLEDASDQDLPTVAELLALRQTEARTRVSAASKGRKASGSVWIAQAGVRGSLTAYSQGSDRYANHMDFGPFGRVDAVSNRNRAWAYNSMRGFEELKGDKLAQALLEHPGAVEGDWNEHFDKIEVARSDKVGERPVFVVNLKKGSLPSRSYWVDAETGDVLLVKLIALENGLRIPMTITQSDFQLVDGLRTAMQITIENPESGRTVLTIESIDTDVELGPEVFTLTDPELDQ